jgi:hypothetical protein
VSPWVAALSLYGVVTALTTYPLIMVVGRAVPAALGDPLLNTWILWWDSGHRPLTAAWWNAPAFYPTAGVMAFSELLLGLLPITAPVQWWSHNPLLAYNVAFLLSFPLSGLAAHALAFELTGRHDAGVLAGLAFAFSPYRANELGHIQMLSYYWAPVALYALHRYLGRDRRPAWLAVFSGAWLLQVLCNGYALFQFSVLIILWLVWFSTTARDVVTIGVAWLCGSLPLVPMLIKYREVQGSLHLKRAITDITNLSADITGFLSAPPDVALWGGRLMSNPSPGLFPGATVLVIVIAAAVLSVRDRVRERSTLTLDRLMLALVALVCAAVTCSVFVIGPWALGPLTVGQGYKSFSLAVSAGLLCAARGPRWRRVWRTRSLAGFYALATVALYVLSFGPAPHARGKQVMYKAPYAWLMVLPGFDAIRVPARFAMLAVLCLAVLVALAFVRWSPVLGNWRRPIWIVLIVGLVADGWLRFAVLPPPAAGPPEPWTGVTAVVELPLGEPDRDAAALYRAIAHGQPLINGDSSSHVPPHYLPMADALGARDVTVLNELAAFGPVGIAVDRSAAGSRELEAALSHLDGVRAGRASSEWATFLARRATTPRSTVGPRLSIRHTRANRHPEDIARMFDHNIETAWGSGAPQDGEEEIILELDGTPTVGAVVLSLGAYSFGYPQDLAVDSSPDGIGWTTAWRGRTAVATVRAALQDPGEVPLLIRVSAVQARFIRLRQLGRHPKVPWWIAELSIHGPASS